MFISVRFEINLQRYYFSSSITCGFMSVMVYAAAEEDFIPGNEFLYQETKLLQNGSYC